mmetsp:Transcript_12561/g.14414  ORF Transcript_12561/g.14414 Transcript_12561/m.14414 type:complete len:533 (+) Transcript_12561:149-1747(+)
MAALDGFSENPASKWSVALGVLTVLAVGVGVVLYTLRRKELLGSSLEDFITARNTSGPLAIGWSMFASAVGSWVILTPAPFGSFGGIITALTYGVATAIPLLFIGFWGTSIRKQFPDVLSFSDFARKQFGVVTQVMVVLISLLNMAIFATAEYTGVYTLFSTYVGMGDSAAAIVLILAFTTLGYTTYGGLRVSILTDQLQGSAALLLTVVAAITLAATFSKESVEESLEGTNFTPSFEVNEFVTGAYVVGYSTMFTLPLSLTCATIFSEAWWARAWAATDEKALKKGALFGAVITFLVVTFWGMVGVLVAWSGIPAPDFNLVAFYPFLLDRDSLLVDSGIAVLMVLLATIMAEGVIDSLMNGIGASVSGALDSYLTEEQAKKHSLSIGRACVVVLNIPIIIVSLQQYDILSLFLLGNMITICCFFPLFLGFFPNVQFLQRNMSDWIFPVNFVGSLIILAVYGAIDFGSVGEGLKFAFWLNANYEYEYFLVAILGTVFWTGILLVISEVFGLGNEKASMEVVDAKVAEKTDDI